MVGYTPKRKSSSENNAEMHDSDSWINIKDEEDPRGRVGIKWPWEEEEEDEDSK